ncbi:hypothetical protein [Fictibacillus phosphorivorans]|uniref:hypothetical protein n=1 Tax=Fictibacillus phosphorivorans TaxID=1221500 RepID=UPI0016426BD1|nr:hypothetical protein [Fictibacillus phosphorivorans]
MFFKNKETGLIWEVTDVDHIKRCNADSNYEEVPEPKKTKEKEDKTEQPKKKPVKK